MSSPKAVYRHPYQESENGTPAPPSRKRDRKSNAPYRRPNLISMPTASSASSSAKSEIFDPQVSASDALDTPSSEPPSPFDVDLPIRSATIPDSPQLPPTKSRAQAVGDGEVPAKGGEGSGKSIPRRRPGRPSRASLDSQQMNSSATIQDAKRPRGRPRKERVLLDPRAVNSSPIRQNHHDAPEIRRASSASFTPRRQPSPSRLSDPDSAPTVADGDQYSTSGERAATIEEPSEPSAGHRPSYKEREFVPYQVGRPKTEREINGLIHKIFRTKRKPPPEKKKIGWVYIMRQSSSSKHVKIGYTNDEPSFRKAVLEKCHGSLVEVEDSHKNAFLYPGVVERLVLAELHNQRKKIKCDCETEHREWVEVESTIALASRNKWRTWIQTQQPFDSKRQLTPYWAWRVERVKEELNSVNWEQWTKPGPLDMLQFNIKEFSERRAPWFVHHITTTRKDKHFWLVGMIIGLLMFIYQRWVGVGLAFIALFAL